ncbi:MAG: Uncharacterised protein [Cryomorphaceae bacterium]|nr:MAG: Uncharacterised protein [Cryomorphaceae bacterium]
MIIYGYSKRALGRLLTNNVFVEVRFDLLWGEVKLWLCSDIQWISLRLFTEFSVKDTTRLANATVTDVGIHTSNHHLCLILTASAEGTVDVLLFAHYFA